MAPFLRSEQATIFLAGKRRGVGTFPAFSICCGFRRILGRSRVCSNWCVPSFPAIPSLTFPRFFPSNCRCGFDGTSFSSATNSSCRQSRESTILRLTEICSFLSCWRFFFPPTPPFPSRSSPAIPSTPSFTSSIPWILPCCDAVFPPFYGMIDSADSLYYRGNSDPGRALRDASSAVRRIAPILRHCGSGAKTQYVRNGGNSALFQHVVAVPHSERIIGGGKGSGGNGVGGKTAVFGHRASSGVFGETRGGGTGVGGRRATGRRGLFRRG